MNAWTHHIGAAAIAAALLGPVAFGQGDPSVPAEPSDPAIRVAPTGGTRRTSAPAASAVADPSRLARDYERLVKENLDQRAQAEKAQKDLNALRKENAGLLLQVDELEEKRRSLAASLKDLSATGELERQLAAEKARAAGMEAELAALRRQLESGLLTSTGRVASTPPPGQSSDLYRRLERENTDLRNRLAKELDKQQQTDSARQQTADADTQLKADVARLTREKEEAEARLRELTAAREKDRKVLYLVARKAVQYKNELAQAQERLQRGAAVASAGSSGGTVGPARSRRWSDLAARSPGSALAASGGGAGAGQRRATDLQSLADEMYEDALAQTERALGDAPVSRRASAAVSDAARMQSDSLFQKGVALTREGRYTEAERMYALALKANPRSAEAHFNMGILYEDHLGNARKAAEHYRQYLALNPDANDADVVQSWIFEMETE